MKQIEIIERLKQNIHYISNVDAMLLIGSFARGNPTYNSDIDLSILIGSDFDFTEFSCEIKNIFQKEIKDVWEIELRNKYVVYFKESPKLEFNICRQLNDIDKYFLGSEISDFSTCVILDRTGEIKNYLQDILNRKANRKLDISNLYQQTFYKFLYDFEQFSHFHRRSDAYKCYFQYNLALNDCFQLIQLNQQKTEFLYLPDIQDYFYGKEGHEKFIALSGTLYLSEVNQRKRSLLSLFYEATNNQMFIDDKTVAKTRDFLEYVFLRDYGYNFRDIADNCSQIKKGFIYRSSSLTRYQNETYLQSFLQTYSINKIVDLRADREKDKNPYNLDFPNVTIIQAPLDPWNQSERFKAEYNYGNDSEIAYRFFALECKESIKLIAQEIIKQKNGAIAIHCHAGKDRTGCIVALLYLLCGATEKELFEDYFASEADTKRDKLNSFLIEIKKYSSIYDYFVSCDLSEREVEQLKKVLLK